MKKIYYWKRLYKAYIAKDTSQLSFWHSNPTINKNYNKKALGPYYMSFHSKANYNGFFDKDGIPMLNYHGSIGLQYNPISIAQWGLGNYNLFLESKEHIYYEKFIRSANWLVNNMEKNKFGFYVWMHHFNFEYRDTLISPWYSGLAQGQGISVLIRAFKETNEDIYKDTIEKALKVFDKDIKSGGVNHIDSNGDSWIEEYIVFPPTHILNGFIWGLWGLYDYAIFFQDKKILEKFLSYSTTITKNLKKYDIKYWSKYEQSNKIIPMISSKFYHRLHIVQLKIMMDLTGDEKYLKYAERWQKQLNNFFYRQISLLHKAIFKVLFY